MGRGDGGEVFIFVKTFFINYRMKKKLIDAIKAKFVGIDDDTAKRLAERIIKKGEPLTTDEEVTAAVEAVNLSDVIKSVSDFSADEATRRYESKYNLKDGKPVEDPAATPPATPPAPPAPAKTGEEKGEENEAMKEFTKLFKGLSDKMEALGADIASLKSGKVTESRRARLNDVIKDLRDTQKKAYGRISFDKMTDDEFESLLGDIQEEVNDLIAENKASGAVVTAPLGGSHVPKTDGKEASKEEIDGLMDKFGLTPSQN